MPKPMRRLLCLLGIRGAILLNVGTIWALIGVVRALDPPSVRTDQEVGLLHYTIPHWWAVWVIAGLAAVVAAGLRRPDRDVWGFFALFLPPLITAVSYGWSALVWLASGGEFGYHLGWIHTVGWVFIALLPYTLSGVVPAESAEPTTEDV